MQDVIHVRGAYRNNLRSINLDIPIGEITVVTGLSGSGKSSLAFDTVYAEGQRRYVETFSAYTRQFLERMDKPQVESIEGIPPAIAVDQTNPVRTSRSTVGTMTELADHLKLLWAHHAELHCRGCDRKVRRDTPDSVWSDLLARLDTGELASGARGMVLFTVRVPGNRTAEDIKAVLAEQGYHRIHEETDAAITVVQDRLKLDRGSADRWREAIETAMLHGDGRCSIAFVDGPAIPYSSDLHCPNCDIEYSDPVPNTFSFNSPIGACSTCRGFGRTMGIDYELVIPDGQKSLAGGAVRVWESKSYSECKDDLLRFARTRGIPTDVPWGELDEESREWVIEGEGGWDDGVWYGVRRFFDWLESRSYKMHIRVLLSRYRAYRRCAACGGARLKPESLQWKIDGRSMHDVNMLPIDDVRAFFDAFEPPGGHDAAGELVLDEIRTRLSYLTDVGVGYLTLDRQSRTLSGGEVQRINLTTALGTRLTNTLFVLDEPSIGLHSRDIDRLILILRRLSDSGNTLLVVEHDPQLIAAADRIVELGPGAGSDGGRVVFEGTPGELVEADTATGRWMGGRESGGAREPVGGGPTVDGESGAGDDNRAGEGGAPDATERPAGGSAAEGRRAPGRMGPTITIHKPREHNLRMDAVSIPLGRLVCITGVSGSGKSTLIEETLYRALLKAKGEPSEAPGEHESIAGAELVDRVVLVDQSSIGKTARSNPASYVGAFDEIRKRFASAPRSVERGYTAGTFSFNSGNGRCPTCGGTGFEHIEMQFLSDVYLRCPDCNGTRYREEILDVTLPAAGGSNMRAASIAEVLAMPVADAARFFADDEPVLRRLAPLVDVGLEYVTLGQPVPTLSGGEAQRLKLGAYLTAAGRNGTGARSGDAGQGGQRAGNGDAGQGGNRGRNGNANRALFLLDEPTTGLHAHDVHRLQRALRSLIECGNSVVVIEHNLDVISGSDYVIDIGPEGGAEGGLLVDAGTPAELVAGGSGHTARALGAYAGGRHPAGGGPVMDDERPDSPGASRRRQAPAGETGIHPAAADTPPAGDSPGSTRTASAAPHITTALGAPIGIVNAREHNLRSISVEIPQNTLTVLTGVSGSGKSTLAFDIVFAEGQRRYLESLNAYARQFVQPAQRPDVDGVFGLPPSVAIEQRTSRGGWKSTVATTTELFHFLRLLFLKLGTQYCPDCNIAIRPQSRDAVFAEILRGYAGRRVTLLAPLVVARKGYYTDLAGWAAKKGYSLLRVDGTMTPTDDWPRLSRYKEHTIELPVAEIEVDPANEGLLRSAIDDGLRYGESQLRVVPSDSVELGDDDAAGARLFSVERSCPGCGTSFPELDPRLFSFNSHHGACERCGGSGFIGATDEELDAVEGEGQNGSPDADRFERCPECGGSRLNRVARAVYFREHSIDRLAAMSVASLTEWIRSVELEDREAAIARDIVAELSARLGFLQRVGLGYLGLDRAAPTLSGGEAQRIRLAAQLGSNLRGICYVLDEPTIGLHARDNRMLLETLSELRDRGNTIVVVEHDADTIRAADHVIDLGPGGGVRGGDVVVAGSLSELMASSESRTGRALADPPPHPAVPRKPRGGVDATRDADGAEAYTAQHASAAGDVTPPHESGAGPTAPGEPGAATGSAAGGVGNHHTVVGASSATPPITISGASLHNLREIDVDIPVGRLTCVTGVSGCGKSSLARGVLYENAKRIVAARGRGARGKQHGGRNDRRTQANAADRRIASSRKRAPLVGCRSIDGLEAIDRVLEVDQTPIGKTPRSCPATYVGVWDDIRRLFAGTPESKLHGFDASRFSFNTKGGRCETCGGQGVVRIEMSFLPDVRMTCETCGAARFTPDTLAIRYKGKSIADVLDMSIEEAASFFSAHRKIHYALALLDEVGLGYLKLGQQSPTLSGGEAQRLKLVTELAKTGGAKAGHTLYVLDEPTIGLHISDVEKLTRVLIRLVDAGNSVVVVEHNLDLIAEADYIIDLGPEGGDEGGRVVADGAPLAIAKSAAGTGSTREESMIAAERDATTRSGEPAMAAERPSHGGAFGLHRDREAGSPGATGFAGYTACELAKHLAMGDHPTETTLHSAEARITVRASSYQ